MSTFIRKNETTPRTSSRMAKTATDSGRRRARRTIHMRGGFRPDVARARTYRHVPHARARMAVAIVVSAPCGGRHEPVLRWAPSRAGFSPRPYLRLPDSGGVRLFGAPIG